MMHGMRYPGSLLASVLLLSAAGCASFDKSGQSPLTVHPSAAPPSALRPALVRVFGSAGFNTVNAEGNPLIFVRPATSVQKLAYQTLGGAELIERCFVTITPSAAGSDVAVRSVLLHRPGTMFEDSNYPVLGTRSYYKKLINRASQQVLAGPPPPSATPRPLPDVVEPADLGY